MADPGFPIEGVDPLGGVDLRCGCFLAKMYTKMKEFGPIGGHALGTPPRSANAIYGMNCYDMQHWSFLCDSNIQWHRRHVQQVTFYTCWTPIEATKGTQRNPSSLTYWCSHLTCMSPLADPGGAPRRPPPQQDQFLSFSHTFSLKSVRVGGWRPPPQREILDPPLVSFQTLNNEQHRIVNKEQWATGG